MSTQTRKASNRRTQLGFRGDWGRREAEVLGLAGGQHGVITHTQLRSLGFSAGALRHRVAAGRLHSVHRGVYALGRSDLPVEGRWMAAVLACGPDALLSHVSAAVLQDLLSSAGSRIDVTIPRKATLSRAGIRVHCSAGLGSADVTRRRGIPCTSVARTLLDLASVAPRGVLVKACERAEVMRVLDRPAMEELLRGADGRRGVRNLRSVLRTSDAIARSELERRFLALCHDAALPSPAVNQWLAIAGEEMQVDFVWYGSELIVETDGFRTHGTRLAFERDRRRDRLLALEGWRVVRFTWHDLTRDPGHVVRVLRDLVSPASSRG